MGMRVDMRVSPPSAQVPDGDDGLAGQRPRAQQRPRSRQPLPHQPGELLRTQQQEPADGVLDAGPGERPHPRALRRAPLARLRLDHRARDAAAGLAAPRARQAPHERLHGVGAGGAQEAGRGAPAAAQRGAQQDPRQAVESASRGGATAVRRSGRSSPGRPQEGTSRLQGKYQPRRRKAGRARGAQQQDRDTPGPSAVKAEEVEAPSSSCQGYPFRSDVSARTTPDACSSSSPTQSPVLHPAFSPGHPGHPALSPGAHLASGPHHHADTRTVLPRPYGDGGPLYPAHYQAHHTAHHEVQYHAHLGTQPHQERKHPCSYHQYGAYGSHPSYAAHGHMWVQGEAAACGPCGVGGGGVGVGTMVGAAATSHSHTGFMMHGAHILGPDHAPHVHGGHGAHPGFPQVSASPSNTSTVASAQVQSLQSLPQPYSYQAYCGPNLQKYS
ncbi:uncharacterized protein LOC113202342 isoform X2 [Frankliniella occidentalis]|uniref:Uncharacterized protein LOC113202342 isoform X2 n=1 Tax=Frankliniella occidentalis TaxID=133901 RepID=A0A9C6TYQ9_FRAOC|nr:uncharacterized protein LOC113202342 isoform X2 [Frankliniella occidentalis]